MVKMQGAKYSSHKSTIQPRRFDAGAACLGEHVLSGLTMRVNCFGDGQEAGMTVRAGPGSVRPPVSPIPSLSTLALLQGHRAAIQTNGSVHIRTGREHQCYSIISKRQMASAPGPVPPLLALQTCQPANKARMLQWYMDVHAVDHYSP